jgi:hypothetical protein
LGTRSVRDVHLVVEGDDRRAFSNGMRALAIRLARQLNALMGTRGALFVDRYHEHVLGTPTQTRNVLRYVLANRAHHLAQRGRAAGGSVDRFSSVGAEGKAIVASPRSWLLQEGWRLARGSPRPFETRTRRL